MGWNEYAGYSERPTLSAVRLSEIFQMDAAMDDYIHGRAMARELHMEWNKKWSDSIVAGVTSGMAIAMIDHSTLTDMDARAMLSYSIIGEPEPTAWPCMDDHSMSDEDFHRALEEDGWQHGDPDEEDDGA